jgi:stress-induced morphogen
MNARAILALQAARRTAAVSCSNTVSRLTFNSFPPRARHFHLTSLRYRPSPIAVPMAAESDTQAAEMSSAADQPIDAAYLQKKLESALQMTHVSIEDMSGGCGQAFNAVIVSPEFEKKTLLARSRLVNGILKQEISAIHAWTPRCLTPEQWEKEKERIG